MIKHLFTLTMLMIVFASCKKEAIDKASTLQNSQGSANESVLAAITQSSIFDVVQNGDGTYTATLQPDDSNGQDAFVAKLNGSPEYATSNNNWQPELDIAAWTVNGSSFFLRSFLRFDDLAKIPSTAKVLSATLYLYGVSSSIASPQGNSTYPGSPYLQYGTNRSIIEPVKGPWDEHTITWNTQPNVNAQEQVAIPKSTSLWNYNAVIGNMRGLVSKAVKYPDRNYGVRISLATEMMYRCMVFASSESTDPTKRPKLVVVYK